MKKLVFAFLALTVSSYALAASHHSVVTSVGAYDATWGLFSIETPIPDTSPLPESCNGRRTTISFDKSTPHGKDMLSIILVAFTTGQKLHIQHFTSTCGVSGVYPLANRVDVIRD